jgi:hypothetical protein
MVIRVTLPMKALAPTRAKAPGSIQDQGFFVKAATPAAEGENKYLSSVV